MRPVRTFFNIQLSNSRAFITEEYVQNQIVRKCLGVDSQIVH